MKQLRVTNIQRGCVYDGPGVRTTVFLKGCSLHCPWCCNPETISYEEQWFVDDEKCLMKQSIQSKLCVNCERLLGTRSIHDCPVGVVRPVSRDYSTDDLLMILLKDNQLYKESNGGVTFSGGEPLLQAEVLTPLLRKLKSYNINIALETTLAASMCDLKQVFPFIDMFIVDLKLQPQMKLGNKSYLCETKKRILLLSNKEVIIRMVFVDEMLKYKAEILKSLNEIGIQHLELLLCHDLGWRKYTQLSLTHKTIIATSDKMHSFFDFLEKNGVNTKMLTI